MSATSSSTTPKKPILTHLTNALSYPVNYAQYAINEPLITGALLYILTRGPPHIRERLLRPFQPVSVKGKSRLETLVGVLKALTAIGVLKKANNALNWLALKNWSLRRQGAPFQFGPAKKELVVITGGCSGFGYEMVKDFNSKARVVILDILALPAEFKNLHGVHYYHCDVTDTDAVVATCEDIRKTHGNPTVLINNAGIANAKTILQTSNENTEKLFKVNLISHFVLIREFLPAMLEMKKGHVVTIASTASFVAAPGLVDYCCSKVAALYLNDGLRNELLSRYPNGASICTTSVHPAWHRTGIIKGLEKFLEKGGYQVDPASNVSRAVVEQVVKGRSGRLYLPKSMESKADIQAKPLWVKDIILKNVLSRKNRQIVLEKTSG